MAPRDPRTYGKWAIVTGATAGIGEAFAYELAAKYVRRSNAVCVYLLAGSFFVVCFHHHTPCLTRADYCVVRGMNVIIISRSAEKLEEVKRGILKEYPGVEVRCMAYDYTDR